jgi:hypothetical protein
MKLRDKIGYDAKREDLGVLLEEPFEIDAKKDMPLIYVAYHNNKRSKFDFVRGLEGLSENQMDRLERGVGYDYTFADKIFMSHMYHKLAEAGLSDEGLDDVKDAIEGKIYSVRQVSLGAIEKVPMDVVEKIWTELKGHPELGERYSKAIGNLVKSSQRELIDSVIEDEQDYFYDLQTDFAKGNPRDTRSRAFNFNYVPSHVSEEEWGDISAMCAHDVSCGMNWIDSSLGYSRR